MSEDGALAPIPVRPAREGDAAEIARLSAQLGYPADAAVMRRRLARIASRADQAVFVAGGAAGPAPERPGRPPALLGWIHVACGMWLESGESAEILGLVVEAAARRAGVGRRLAGVAEQWSRSAGLARILVRSNTVRTEAHVFYPNLGYTLAKTQCVYVKPLSGSPTADG